MLKPNAYIEQLSRNKITVTFLQNSGHMEYLRNKQTDLNAHSFEGNELNKDIKMEDKPFGNIEKFE